MLQFRNNYIYSINRVSIALTLFYFVFTMQLKFYPVLNARSKKAIRRKNKRFGHPYHYVPRQSLVNRLMVEFSMSESEVREQLLQEREFILKYPNYYP